MSKTTWRFVFLGLLCTAASLAQEGVTIRVNAAQTIGAFKPISQYFGYDEPNYTYTANGKKLIGELGNLAGNPKAKTAPPYIRAHFMLATGDGTPSLKWGSTNAYTEDAAGKPVYDWTIIDRIIDTYMKAGAKPFLEIGFMPQALSTHPEPYPAIWKPGAANTQYSVGWTYPPKDFAKWGALVHEWAKHEVAKYGRAEVATWYWEVWNEPDISYWHGTPEEYDQLYDFAVDGVRRALPEAKVGGPATTGPAGAKAAAYLKQFLEHCDSGKNAATGATGAPLDFITYHAKGSTSVFEGHVRMGVGKNTADAAQGMKIVAAFPKFKNLPIVISESDPEGCAACTARVYPQNAYRNGPQYAAYQAVMMKNLFELADREGTNIAGMLTWAFEFEGQPYFEGFRTLASNGLDKPILNLFRMTARMSGNRVMVESSGAIPVDAIQAAGVRANPDVDAIAARSDREISVLMWNYHDDDVPGQEATIRLAISGLPANVKKATLRHYRIDDGHSNAWSAWKAMGSPQEPTAEQYKKLEAAGQLQEVTPASSITVGPEVKLDVKLPREALSLVQVSW